MSTFSIVNDDPAREKETFWESVFTLSNTAMGMRGTEDEGTEQAQPGLYIAGLFDQSERLVPEIVSFPDILPVWLEVNGEKISADACAVAKYHRELDMEHGVLLRTVTFETAVGACRVSSRRFLSFFDRNCGAVEYSFAFANYSGPVTVKTWTNTCQPSREGSYSYDESVMHYTLEGFNDQFEENAWARVRLRDRGTLVDLAGFVSASRPVRNRVRKIHYDRTVDALELDVIAGEPCIVTKYFVIGDSREVAPQVLKHAVLTRLERMKRAGFEEELQRSAFVLSRHWKNADVRIEGDEEMQRMLRYNIYQLIALGSEHASAFGIGAKGLSSEHYGGHYFWDTEIYLLPYYLNTNPAVARNLLEFRFRTLDAARRRAREQGFAGCLWPWQSDELGNEAIRHTVTADGRVLRRDILDQYHIVSDVAYACFQYYHQTGDEYFLRAKLMPVIVDSLRFWKSLIFRQNDPAAKEYHIRGVMGPDEYHMKVDDNYYTNFLTRYVFESFFDYLDNASPKQRWDVEQWNGLDAAEIESLRTIGQRIYLPPLRDGVIEQFEGYFQRLDVPITEYSDLGMPSYPDPTVGAGLPATERQEALLEHAARTQLIKQADAALPICLLPDKFTHEEIRATFEYYDRRTLQYSSLSPGVCAIVGAKAGAIPRAYQLFRLGASMDLCDVKNETRTGLHTACHGGTYLGAVGGFAGVQATPECLEIRPQLPAHWQGISFVVYYRGVRVGVECKRDHVRIAPEGSLVVKVNGAMHRVASETRFPC